MEDEFIKFSYVSFHFFTLTRLPMYSSLKTLLYSLCSTGNRIHKICVTLALTVMMNLSQSNSGLVYPIGTNNPSNLEGCQFRWLKIFEIILYTNVSFYCIYKLNWLKKNVFDKNNLEIKISKIPKEPQKDVFYLFGQNILVRFSSFNSGLG